MHFHWDLSFIAFAIYPYISLSFLIGGSIYRYVVNPHSCDSKSSEILDKDTGMFWGSNFFHYGIIFALLGHIAGLLVPQRWYDYIGITERIHLALAAGVGMVVGWAAVVGLFILVGRRLLSRRVLSTSDVTDIITLLLLLVIAGLGTYNVTFYRWENVLHDIAPWLRSIFLFSPAYELLDKVPLTYKMHFLAVWTFFAFYPFSRLVHATSAPVTYLYRTWILFRKRCEGF
jgi:nitrate reductase gamma subunit